MTGFNLTRWGLHPHTLNYHRFFYYTTINKYSFSFKNNPNKSKQFKNIIFNVTIMQCNTQKKSVVIAPNVRSYSAFLSLQDVLINTFFYA